MINNSSYFIPLSFAPAFFTGGVYVILGRFVSYHVPKTGLLWASKTWHDSATMRVSAIPLTDCLQMIATASSASYLKPRTITIVFISGDVFALVLQSIGGALTATADTADAQTRGTHILTAGLAIQVVSIFFFLVTWALFAWRLHRNVPKSQRNPVFTSITRTWLWRGFQPAVFAAMFFILIRCLYRAVELNQGFGGALANDETTFMILEAPMIIIAAGLVTVFHPGLVFHGQWRDAAWKWNGRDEVYTSRLEKTTQEQESPA